MIHVNTRNTPFHSFNGMLVVTLSAKNASYHRLRSLEEGPWLIRDLDSLQWEEITGVWTKSGVSMFVIEGIARNCKEK